MSFILCVSFIDGRLKEMEKQKSKNNLKNEGKANIAEQIKNNTVLMLIICCGMPLIVLLAAIYFFGLNRTYLLWFMLLLCPLMHYLMMKDTHKDSGNKNKKEKRGCH